MLSRNQELARSVIYLCVSLITPIISAGQINPRNAVWKPPELLASDSEIRGLLAEPETCLQPMSDRVDKFQEALKLAESRGLLRDRALVQANLASAYIGLAQIELAFSTFQKALQDSIDSKNGVLEADILISLASEAQMRGDTPHGVDLISRALDISETSGSRYEKARALGELGRLRLLLGKTDEARDSIEEALNIDKLNGYRFESLHLVYRGYYLGLAGKVDQAIDSLTEAKTKALAAREMYSFIMAESAYAFGLVKKGRADEAIRELSLLKEANLQNLAPDNEERTCLASTLALPTPQLIVLEGLANALEAANQKQKELEVLQELYSSSQRQSFVAGEAEAAQQIAELSAQLKKSDDALKYYGLAANLYRKLQNEGLLEKVEFSQAVLLIDLGRGKEAISLINEIISYARRYKLRSLEFRSYLQLGQIYQPAGEITDARNALERAESLLRPRPFDEEIDNREVLNAYLRLADVYRALKIPTGELAAIDKAFFVAVHLKDEKLQGNLVGYLDQRLEDLRIRELVSQREKEGRLEESLFYACILFIRDGMPKPSDDNSNWNRILTLPFKIAQTEGGAKMLEAVLNGVESFIGSPKVAMLDALSRYYIASGNDPSLAEKYALRSREVANSLKIVALQAENACVLAIAYSRELKTSLAKSELDECSKLAKQANDEQSSKFAAQANALVPAAVGDFASAKDSLEQLLATAPDDPELHVELAMSLAARKLYERAASQLDFAVAKFTAKGDRKTAAAAYVRVAIALNLDDSVTAQTLQLQYLRSGQSIYHQLNAQAEEGGTLNALGEYYLKLSQLKSAIEQFEKARDVAQKTGRTDILAQTFSDLGNAYQSQKDFKRAKDFHRRAATTYHELKNPALEAFSLQNLGRDYAGLNETDESLSSFLEARAAAALGPPLSQYYANLSLAEAYTARGQFENSLAILRETADLTKLAGDLEHCGYSHIQMAELDGLIGAWDDALGESEAALKIFEEIDNIPGQAASWAALTGIYSDRNSSLKNFAKAQECYAKARERGYGDSLQLDFMEVYLQTGKYAQAAEIANQSIQRCLADSNIECQAHGLLSVSEAQRLSGDIKSARSSLNQARPLASKSHDLYLHGRLLYAEARQLTSERKLDEALTSYKELISLIETVKGHLEAKQQRAISDNYGYIYDELVSLLYSMFKRNSRDQLKLASESLEYAEINKARQFAESWGRTFVNQMQRTLPASVQETERSLFSKRDRILTQLKVSGTLGEPLEKKNAQAELAAVQQELARFLKELRTKSPQYAAVAYPELIQMSSLPLKKGETLVEFKMTDDSTFAWVVQNPTGSANELVSFYKVPQKRTWFLDRISLLRKALNSGHPETINWKISEEIFTALFPGDASAKIMESRNIIFIPDDVLFALPFELYSPAASQRDFLFLTKASSYYPSAVSFRLARTASHQSNWQEAFLGLADPITSSDDDRFEAANAIRVGPTQPSARTGKSSDSQKDPPVEPDRLKARGFLFERLPATATEVRNIAALLQKTNERVEVRVGIDATKNGLLDTDLSKFRFLHFATHGILPVDTGIKEPALVLSYDGIAPANMFLSMSEILGLKLQAESVVLSACNTGSGNISRAEGVMSLGRAFLAAGSSSVTVSLWQVSDESTAVLMEHYYQGVLAGKAKNVALAEARQVLFSTGYKDPFFWAPFIVIGE